LGLCSDVGEAPSDTMSEDVDSEVYPSEDGKFNFKIFQSCSATLFILMKKMNEICMLSA